MIYDKIIDILTSMGSVLKIPISFVVIEFVATFTAAISGIRLASAKKFDLFGALIVGAATAIGGGTMRDIMLNVPPFWMTNPIYIVCITLSLVYVMLFSKYLVHQNNMLFFFDAIALALFNTVGIEKALANGFEWWTAILMGTITGAAGGVVRDVFINEIPLIFRKEIYAVACVAGGFIYILCNKAGMPVEATAFVSTMSVILIRVLAVRYHWSIPVLTGEAAPNDLEQEENK